MNAVSSSDLHPTTSAERAQMRRWLENWQHVGPLLDAERWERLRAMTDRQRARMTLDLLNLWQPGLPGDDGEALIRVQRAFAIWRKKRA